MVNIRNTGIFGNADSGTGLLKDVPIEAVAPRIMPYLFLDFIGTAQTALTNWTVTNQGGTGGVFGTNSAAPTANQDDPNGTVRVFSTTIDEGVSVQFDGTNSAGAWLAPVAGRTIVFETALTFGTASIANCCWFAGLMALDTLPVSLVADATYGNPIAVGGDNCLGFGQRVNTAASLAETQPFYMRAGTAVGNLVRTSTGKTITDGTIVQMGIRLEGMNDVSFYWGTRSTSTTEPGGTRWNTQRLAKVRMATALAAGVKLTPTFYILDSSAADVWFDIDYILTSQSR